MICEDDDNHNRRIEHSKHLLQKRMRSKLLTFLKAGCDPNVLDNVGKSPSDYARQDGVWSQWRWALLHAEYIYDVIRDNWVRRVQAVMSLD